ncbi:MAG TPA: fibronectin type III domain-containing protein [Actinomycetota bacterium]|nr:fibronectin type III domain-containing protein [Actinomycetota bacterium]
MTRFRPSVVAVVAAVAILASGLPAGAEGGFTRVVGFATKTGYRGVVAWEADRVVSGQVHYGTSPTSLDRTASPVPGAPDRAQVSIFDGLQTGTTYWYQVEDRITGERSEMGSFTAANAYTDYDAADTTYTIDLVVTLDSEALPNDVPKDQSLQQIAAAMNVMAERTYDALDGFARIGTVLITDTNLDYAANTPFTGSPACQATGGSLGDFLFQTTLPMDSHTFGGFAINSACTQIGMGRLAQLGLAWQNDLHVGYVATHELMHYAFNTPDLYSVAGGDGGCVNSDWDGSLMHNTGGWSTSAERWQKTELERNSTLTPCNMGRSTHSWTRLRARYTNVPARPDGPVEHIIDTEARGNEDGGALEIFVLDREPGMSTLTKLDASALDASPPNPPTITAPPL